MSTAEYTSADLVFDPDTHTTKTPDGRPVPHVTKVLQATGVGHDFEELVLKMPRFRRTLENASARGTAVHADCHAFDDEDLDINDCDPQVRPYVEAWAICRDNLGLRPVAHGRERQVFDPIDWYTGILDGVFSTPYGSYAVVDLKTGNPDDAAAHIQTAPYQRAWNLERFDDAFVTRRMAIWLQPGLKIPYKVFDYSTREHDYELFRACLTVYNNQPPRRAAVR